MFSWMGWSKDPAPSILGFGKVPATAEYVRCGPKTDAAMDFEQWLTGAIEWAAGCRADRWKAEHDNAPVQCFLYRSSKENQLITGVLRPSRDAVGRRFPLVIAIHVPSRPLFSGLHLTPMLLAGFFQRATSLLDVAARVRSSSEFQGVIDRLEIPDTKKIEVLSGRYEAWARETLAWDFFEQLFQDVPVDAAQRALHIVLDAAAPFKGKESPRTSLSIRFPLPPNAKSGVQDYAFWLDIVRLASGWKQTVPGYFASEGKSVLVQLGEPAHDSLLADAWVPDPASDYVCDTRVVGSGKLITPLPDKLRATLEDPSSTLADVLHAIE